MKENYLGGVALRSSPHIWRGVSIKGVMRTVVWSLLPVVAASIYYFGLSALALVVVTTLSCVLTEYLFCKCTKKPSTINDCSAVITGIMLALTLPPGFPLWIASLGGVVAILLGKLIFGGLGFNPFNPALVGRAFLQAAFPVAITTWSEPLAKDRFFHFISSSLTIPFTNIVPNFYQKTDAVAGATSALKGTVDAVAGATPLAAFKFSGGQVAETLDLFLGQVSGSVGETSAFVILLCGLFLIIKRIVDWRIPVGIFGTVLLLSFCLGFVTEKCPPPFFMLFSGGLVFGGVFMATDMVTSPVTTLGTWIYAVLIGVLVVVIRSFGALPEGVMYAILIGNAVTPLLNRVTQPKIFGAVKSTDRDGVKKE